MKLYALTGDKRLGRTLQRYFHFAANVEMDLIEPIKIHHTLNSSNLISIFENICQKLANDHAPFEKTIVLVDPCLWGFVDAPPCTSLTELEPLSEPPGVPQLLAMLILAFPGIYWVFLSTSMINLPANKNEFIADSGLIKSAHIRNPFQDKLEEIFDYDQQVYEPLFDPAGLRNIIRKNIERKEKKERGIPMRYSLAASIDDEISYAYMHAYTAYRLGFRSHMVTTHNYMKRILGKDDNTGLLPIKLTFEDLFLNFANGDRDTQKTHFSKLKERDNYYKGLTAVEKRIFITVGHQKTPERELSSKNKAHLRTKGQKFKFLYKPISGIFKLKKEAGIEKPTHFKWPPIKLKSGVEGGGHSAPGRLLLITKRLVKKARYILHSTQSAVESVYGAVMALEAQELLANRTPTSALEALALKHQLEVSAECMFYGVQYNFEVKARLEELEKEVQAIGEYFNPDTRKISEINARLEIITALALIFRQYNQFDEESLCLKEIRKLHARATLIKNKSWYWIFYPIRRYIEILVGSLPLFLLFVIFWPLLFGIIYYYSGIQGISSFPQAIVESIVTFFSLGKPDFYASASIFAKAFVALEIIFGFSHIGIFISYLYNLIFRR
ncbi:MAG: hypothetical protein PVH61_10530 [Candidatus Aminicenantes bacterium]